MDLTKRQKEIFDFIRRYGSKYGYPPTVREIGKAVGLHSSSTVHAHLANLEKVGLLRRDPTKPRAIELLVDKAKRAIRPGLPLVGHVAAGEPILAEENIEEDVQVPSVIGAEQGDYVLTVKGDSFRDAAASPALRVAGSQPRGFDPRDLVRARCRGIRGVFRLWRLDVGVGKLRCLRRRAQLSQARPRSREN